MKTNIPKLRFIEFKDAPAWEENELCEEAQITMGQSPSSKFYSIDSNSTILIQGNADLKKGAIVPRIYTESITKRCQKNDIIMTVRAPVGDLAISQYDACIGRGVCAIRGNKYIYYVLEKLKENSYWDKLSTGTTISAVTSNDIKELKLKIPNLLEQEKIGKFLSILDRRIELQEKLIEKLEEEKKGYLQKLFPKKGKSIPELRIEEFKNSGAWITTSLGEVATIKYGFTPSTKNEHNFDGGYVWYGITDFNGKYLNKSKRTLSKSSIKQDKLIKAGTLLMSFKLTLGKLAITEVDCYTNEAISSLVPYEDHTEFLYYFLQNTDISIYASVAAQGMTLNSESLNSISIKVPCSFEQVSIIDILSKIDSKIELCNKIRYEIISEKKTILKSILV